MTGQPPDSSVTLPASARARLTPAEPGLLPGRVRAGAPPSTGRSRNSPRWRGSSQPGRLLQRLGPAFTLSFAERLHGHGAIPFVQIDPTLRLVSGIADRYLRRLPAYLCRQRPGLRPRRRRRLRARDERHLVPLGLRARQAGDFVAAWRHIVTLFRGRAPTTSPGCGRSNRTARHRARRRLVAGRAATSPGSASTATTSARPTPSPASSAAPSPRCGAFTDKPILLSETAVGPAPASSARSMTCSTEWASTRRSVSCGST